MKGDWSTINKGADFIVLALIQIWSYPFHDPVLTDHGFITRPKGTKRVRNNSKLIVFVASFLTAGVLAGSVIALFSFVGIYGAAIGISGSPPEVARVGLFSFVQSHYDSSLLELDILM